MNNINSPRESNTDQPHREAGGSQITSHESPSDQPLPAITADAVPEKHKKKTKTVRRGSQRRLREGGSSSGDCETGTEPYKEKSSLEKDQVCTATNWQDSVNAFLSGKTVCWGSMSDDHSRAICVLQRCITPGSDEV
eukprot:scaffold3553_cov180-Ochromonas_danica.AAC.2